MEKTRRKTEAQKSIWNIFSQSTSAISHRQLQEQLSDICDRVTIYRVLDRLLHDGMIHKVLNPDGTTLYAKCNTNCEQTIHSHYHLHFSCTQCQTTQCLNHVIPKFEMPKGFTTLETSFAVVGICDQCQINN